MPYNRDVYSYLPTSYSEYFESRELLDAFEREYARLYASRESLQDQLRISTATWGIREWERICGLPSDETKTIEERRSNVIARVRGSGVVTAGLIREVAMSYAGGEVEVTSNSSAYTITIKFVSEYGIPTNIADLQAVLRDLVPAHLGINYMFRFVTYDNVRTDNATYGALTARNITYQQLREER